MTVGTETLFKRICSAECINQTLLKGYDRLIDRMSLQKGNVHAINIMSKDEILTLLDRICLKKIRRQKAQTRRDWLQTFNAFQKLLGDISSL